MSMPPELSRRRIKARPVARPASGALIAGGEGGEIVPAKATPTSSARPCHPTVAGVLVPASPEVPLGAPPTPPRERFYTLKKSEIVLNRYNVRHGLGYGSFGTVVKAEDNITQTAVAIKFLHNLGSSGGDTSRKNEADMYYKVLAGCDPHIDLFAAVLATSVHRGFHCIVFELCQCTLQDVLQTYSGLLPLPARHLREMAYQLVKAVQYLHSLGIVHTDLKPDNIGLRCQDNVMVRWLDTRLGFREKKILISTQICIIDLGNAVEIKGSIPKSGRVGALPYRAPEVILGLSWSFGVDAFAIGCVLAELYLMEHLFDGAIENDHEHLATVDRLLGPFPEAYARRIDMKYPGTFVFGDRTRVRYPPVDVSPSIELHLDPMRRLEATKALPALVHDAVLHDLMRKLMALDPMQRIPLADAARHCYFDALNKLQLQ
ncbi:kinase-like protein [Trametes cingulata]|nr:kinase-like protein [Trametes cingulata]